MSALTPIQQQVYNYILKCLELEHHFPTLPQISADFGWRSPNAAFDVVAQLEKKGHLTRTARGKHMLAKHILWAIPCETSGAMHRSLMAVKPEATYTTTPSKPHRPPPPQTPSATRPREVAQSLRVTT